ncbi:protein kinase [Actinosynnema sp. NPDC059335]|uniref:protein kinase domain-containing protein n=1 Tax=Actinosynnema sp. NPDC059335 TaxID=3346804 RepID=UPI00366E39CB
MSRKVAILAGINKYSGRWSPLDCCLHDIEEVAAVLSMPEYGFSTQLLRDEQVTRTAMTRALVEARNSGAEQIVLYFSGHGAATELGTYVVTYDNEDFDEGIELRKLVDLLGSGPGDQQNLILLDCCHSGAAVTSLPGSHHVRSLRNGDVTDVLRPNKSVAVMAACTSDQLAWEARNTGHGIFTHYLLQAMLGDASDHQGNLTANSLYDVVSRNMANHETTRDENQKPVFGGHVSGRLVLASGLTPTLPPPLPEDEFRVIEAEAAALIEDYNQFKSRFDTVAWRASGHDACSRKLEAVDKWFSSKSRTPGLAKRVNFRQSMETLLRYRIELGTMGTGTVIPEGELEERIGEGGFGTVWKVLDRETGKRVALKLYHPHEMSDAEKAKRFENGYDAMRLLKHPRIVAVQRYSRCPTGFVMDYIEGSNLRDLEPHSFMEPQQLIRMLIEIAETIQHAHLHQVIHRDIKPENIVCQAQPDGTFRPYLTDFDLAWFNTKTQRATKTAMGAIYYAAPEQFSNFDPKAALTKTPALDVFSYGQLLHYCFTGRDPDPVRLDVNRASLEKAAVRAQLDNASVLALCNLYRKATIWEYTERTQDFAEVLRDLREVEKALLYTDDRGELDRTTFLAELIFRLTGRPVVNGSTSSFVSSAGTWEVSFTWQDRREGRAYRPLLNAHFTPQDRIGLENVPNAKMRKTLNQRLEHALRQHLSASHKSGKHGTYEVFVDIFPCELTFQGVNVAANIISDSLGSLSL